MTTIDTSHLLHLISYLEILNALVEDDPECAAFRNHYISNLSHTDREILTSYGLTKSAKGRHVQADYVRYLENKPQPASSL